MRSQLLKHCRILAVIAFITTILSGMYALDQTTKPGPAGVCIASAIVLGTSLIAMAILKVNEKDQE